MSPTMPISHVLRRAFGDWSRPLPTQPPAIRRAVAPATATWWKTSTWTARCCPCVPGYGRSADMSGDTGAKAFDFAQDVTKQLITLSTGVIALTITFLKDVATKAPSGALDFLHIAWVLFL